MPVLLVRPFPSKLDDPLVQKQLDVCTFPIIHFGCWQLEGDWIVFLFLKQFLSSLFLYCSDGQSCCPSVFVLFRLITCGIGRVNRVVRFKLRQFYDELYKALVVLIHFSIVFDEAWCGRTALIIPCSCESFSLVSPAERS